jgi:hypothetical protein
MTHVTAALTHAYIVNDVPNNVNDALYKVNVIHYKYYVGIVKVYSNFCFVAVMFDEYCLKEVWKKSF